MARERRAQLLLPSFAFVIAAAVACGGTVVGEAPLEPSTTGAGGTSFTTNPTPIAVGGRTSTNPPPIGRGGSASGGYSNDAGDTSTLPASACPPFVPPQGSSCLSPARGGPNECAYATHDACTTILAWCNGSAWSLSEYSILCNGFAGAAGAAGAAGEGGSAGQAPIADAGSAGDEPGPLPVVYCPLGVPTAGGSCYKPSAIASYRCDYALACGVYEATCNGQWQLAFHDANSCSAGAAGN